VLVLVLVLVAPMLPAAPPPTYSIYHSLYTSIDDLSRFLLAQRRTNVLV